MVGKRTGRKKKKSKLNVEAWARKAATAVVPATTAVVAATAVDSVAIVVEATKVAKKSAAVKADPSDTAIKYPSS